MLKAIGNKPDLLGVKYESKIPIGRFVEWPHNPHKRSVISDHRLEADIKTRGVLTPLAVTPTSAGHLLVSDGNRRLRIARRLEIPTLQAFVFEGWDPAELAVALNTTGRTWDIQTWAQFVVKEPAALDILPSDIRRRVAQGQHVLGADFADFVQDHSLAIIEAAMRVAKALGEERDLKYVRKIVKWVTKHKLVVVTNVAVALGISPGQIRKSIEADEPLRIIQRHTLQT